MVHMIHVMSAWMELPASKVRAESLRPVDVRAEQACRGDRDALATLLREHGPSIARLCHFIVGPVEAADATQDAFERIIQQIQSFDPKRGAFRTWAFTVARNTCRDRLRRRGLERAKFADVDDVSLDVRDAMSVGPEERVLARADAQALGRALEMLPEPMRVALVLFHMNDATYQEIADMLGVPIGTVMTWLHRGRKKLRQLLESSAPMGEA